MADFFTGLGQTAVDSVKAGFEIADNKKKSEQQMALEKEMHDVLMEQERERLKQLKLEGGSQSELLDIGALLVAGITENNVKMVAQMSQRAEGLDMDMLIAAHDIALSLENKAIIRLTQMALDKKKKSLVLDAVGGFKQAPSAKKSVPPKCEAIQKQINPKQLSQELVAAVKSSDAAGVRRAVLGGANPNCTMDYISPFSGKTFHNFPILYHAAMYQALDVVEAILSAPGVKVDLPDPIYSRPPLVEASLYGYTDICRALLAHGADPNGTDSEGYHSIFLAAQIGHRAVIELLLSMGGDPEVKVQGKWTAAAIAKQNGFVDLAKWLSLQRKK